MLKWRLAEATESLRVRGSRRVLREYSNGLYFGVVASVFLLVVMGFASTRILRVFGGLTGQSDLNAADVVQLSQALVCIGGGAAGSTLSVLLRLRNAPRLDYQACGTSAAVVRIVLGCFFAVGLLALVKGHIVTFLQQPSLVMPGAGEGARMAADWFFWGALGFLAGFNERFARDLVTRSPEPEREPGPAGAAGSAPAKPAGPTG